MCYFAKDNIMKKCHICSAELLDNDNFCGVCGAKNDENATVSQIQPIDAGFSKEKQSETTIELNTFSKDELEYIVPTTQSEQIKGQEQDYYSNIKSTQQQNDNSQNTQSGMYRSAPNSNAYNTQYNEYGKLNNVPQNEEISFWQWITTILITYIPIVNIIMLLIWSFSPETSESKKNWARAFLAVSIVLGAISIIFGLITFTLMINSFFTGMRTFF